MSKIIQKENFNLDFGYCLRSSAIFYIPPKPIKTKFIFANYWLFKNNIEVFLLINFRNIKGELIRREALDLRNKNVFEIETGDVFGSCEIEAFSSVDLKIPYSAIMAVYESKESISMVHSYSRVYSNIEVEDKKTICDGHEGCWVLKDNSDIETFGVLHNGSKVQDEQKMKFIFKNYMGDKKVIDFYYEKIQPYETVVIKPNEIFPDLKNFLDGKEGSCSFHFLLANSFTRMLIGWQKKDYSQIQVTHSNFDYSVHETDFIFENNKFAYMTIPNIKLPSKKTKVVVYPDRSVGNYFLKTKNLKEKKLPGNLYSFYTEEKEVKFFREDGHLPSRIVTAIQIVSSSDHIIPAECSLGSCHAKVPPKKFHWGIWSAKFNSDIIIGLKSIDIYGDPKDSLICLRLYNQKNVEIHEIILNWEKININNLCANLKLDDFIDDSLIDKDNFMYVSLFSDYGGFIVYTTLQKGDSITLEHTF